MNRIIRILYARGVVVQPVSEGEHLRNTRIIAQYLTVKQLNYWGKRLSNIRGGGHVMDAFNVEIMERRMFGKRKLDI